MSSSVLWVGAVLIAVALMTAAWLVIVPSRALPLSRRRWSPDEAPQRPLEQVSARVVDWIDTRLGDRGFARRWTYALDRAGVRMPLAEFVLVVGGGLVATFVLGFLVTGGSVIVGLLAAAILLVVLVAAISLRAERRKAAFAEVLDDMVQFLGTNLRSGHSVLQSLEAVGREIEEPAKSEILRIVNQTRLGRDLGESMHETAYRMDSDDFRWVAEAVAIHRQVGGNLGEVLDVVSGTIRERQQVRRQVKALSAEGRISAIILLALPVVVGVVSALLNTEYTGLLWTTPLGVAMLCYAILSMIVGAFWLRKVVTVTF